MGRMLSLVQTTHHQMVHLMAMAQARKTTLQSSQVLDQSQLLQQLLHKQCRCHKECSVESWVYVLPPVVWPGYLCDPKCAYQHEVCWPLVRDCTLQELHTHMDSLEGQDKCLMQINMSSQLVRHARPIGCYPNVLLATYLRINQLCLAGAPYFHGELLSSLGVRSKQFCVVI